MKRGVVRNRASTACAVLALTVPFFVYVCSLMPSFGFGDIGEMQTVPYIFGVPHPTGFPTFVIIAGVFAHLFPIGNVAWRINLFSALAVAVSAWALFAALREVEVLPVASLSAALVFAFTQAVWFHATRADVHDFVLCFEAIAFLYVMRWRVRGRARDLVLGCIAVGVALATHPLALWALPGLLVLVLTGTRRIPARVIPSAIGALLAPLLLYCYIPLRSAEVSALRRDPTVALGLPPGQPFWDYAHTSGGIGNLMWFLSGAQFSPDRAIFALLSPSRIIYAIVHGESFAFHQLLVVAFIIASISALMLLVAEPSLAIGSLLAGGLVLPFTFAYSIEGDPTSYLLFVLWILAFVLGTGSARLYRAPKSLTAAVVLLLALGLFWANRGIFNERNDVRAPAYVRDVLSQTPDNAIVVAPWVLATPIAYCIYIEHRCGGRLLVTAKLERSVFRTIRSLTARPIYEVKDRKPMPIVKEIR